MHRFWDIRRQKFCNLENRVRGSSRSLKISPFDRAHMTSYWRSIVTMALSCVVWDIQCRMKKALRETQTLRAGCSKAEPKNLAPPQTPFQGAQDSQNLISWKWSLLYLQTQFGEDRCTQFRVIVVTESHTHKHTHPQTGPIAIHCAAASLARSVITWNR